MRSPDIDDRESFNISRAMVENYPEYCMLKKLQQLTPFFFCSNCKQQLDFANFFAETHDCIFDDKQVSEIALRNQAAQYQDTLPEHNESSVVLEEEERKSPA
jgi:hypothetical protein